MLVRTEVSKQAEQFEMEGRHYVGRRVLCGGLELSRNFAILFQLDDGGGLIFVDPSILRPYQRPERKEND